MLPRISVVTPSYNQGEYLSDTLGSIHDQGYPNLEHIVMDGGSTDNSVEIIRGYSSRLAFWTSERDGGPNSALVDGFGRASGDILCWLNSDDLFEPGCLFEVARFFAEHPEAEVVYGDAVLVDRSGQPIRPKKEHPFNRFIWLHDYNFIPQPSTFWRRQLYDRVGGLDKSFHLAYDGDLWVRFAEVARIHHVRRKWSRMRIYAEQRNQKLRAQSDLEDMRIRARYVEEQPMVMRRAKSVAAKGLRISWKLATGCYWY
jgi:glycosyltransferase involved in cell wall biosynthesis